MSFNEIITTEEVSLKDAILLEGLPGVGNVGNNNNNNSNQNFGNNSNQNFQNNSNFNRNNQNFGQNQQNEFTLGRCDKKHKMSPKNDPKSSKKHYKNSLLQCNFDFSCFSLLEQNRKKNF